MRGDFRALLEAGDVDALRRAWAKVAPHLPQPKNRDEAEITMHYARTTADSLPLRARAYSHKWLCERELPSGLPVKLKPKAERLYPVISDGVGISINFKNPFFKPAAIEIRTAMEGAVNEAYADGRRDPAFVTLRMKAARDRAYRALFGGALTKGR